jgi:hypothetical protein
MYRVLIFDWKESSPEALDQIAEAFDALGNHSYPVETYGDSFALVVSDTPMSQDEIRDAYEYGNEDEEEEG